MPRDHESLLLAPGFTLIVRWSARITDFVDEWQQRQARANPARPLEFWAEAADAALGGVEQGHHQALDVLADIYRTSGLLPAVGDLLVVEALEMKVDHRRFTRRRVGGVAHTEVLLYLGVERYIYETRQAQRVQGQLSSTL